jgi:translation elongation factor EF-Ts
LAQKALDNGCSTQEALASAEGVKTSLEQLIYTLRENVALRRVTIVESNLMGVYMHQRVDAEMGIKADKAVNGQIYVGGKLAVIDFDLSSDRLEAAQKKAQPLVDKLAVHVLSMDPKAIDKASAPEGTDVEDILMEQEFGLGGEGKTVGQVIGDMQKKLTKSDNTTVSLRAMHRFICGEGVEKKSGEDFGAEVAKLLNKD